jgi:four helix bundle suffix protein
MELKLTNVARASLEELRLDYEDFLRQRGLVLWNRDDSRRAELVALRPKTADDVAVWVREVGKKEKNGLDGRNGQDGQEKASTVSTQSTKSMPSTSSIDSPYSEIAANAALVLIGVAGSLLDRQLAAQAGKFEEEGGFTERLHRVRTQARRK